MAEAKEECLNCGSTRIEKGYQEMFPTAFMPGVGSIRNLAKVFSDAREMVLFACLDCGHVSWFFKEHYLKKLK